MTPGERGMRATCALAAALTAVGMSPAYAQYAPAQQSGPAPAAGVEPGLPETTPMTDLLTRMDALETQVARLTAQNEEMANRQRQIEAKLNPTPAAAPTMGPPNDAGTPPPATPTPAPAPNSASASNLSAMTDGASDHTADAHPAGPAHASAQRIAAVKAVIKPQTGNAALDEYSYGFRLYTAKFYPEAAQQLQLYIDKYPKDAHIGFARNLLGRAYLDDGKPGDAAPWFLTNYKADQHGPRAADSLLNLAEAMRQLGKTAKACIAMNEFAANFGAEAQGRLRQDYTRTRGALTCS